MAVANTDTPLLMIIERDKAIIPVSPVAFRVGQRSKGELRNHYKGTLVIYPDGQVLPIDHIDILGLWGSSFYRKLISALSGVYEIKVHFGKAIPMSLEEFKRLIIRYIGYDNEQGDPYLSHTEPLEIVFQRVNAASSFSEVFKCINVPQPQDCLDVL